MTDRRDALTLITLGAGAAVLLTRQPERPADWWRLGDDDAPATPVGALRQGEPSPVRLASPGDIPADPPEYEAFVLVPTLDETGRLFGVRRVVV